MINGFDALQRSYVSIERVHATRLQFCSPPQLFVHMLTQQQTAIFEHECFIFNHVTLSRKHFVNISDVHTLSLSVSSLTYLYYNVKVYYWTPDLLHTALRLCLCLSDVM